MSEQNELQVLNRKTPTTPLVNSKQESPPAKSEWTKLLSFAGFGSTLGCAVPAGYCIGVMNSPAMFMRDWCNITLIERYDYNLTATGIDFLWSSIVSIFLVGGAIGSLTGAGVANKFGRKGCFMICGVLLFIGALCFYFCRMLKLVELLLIGRFLVGLGSGLTTACLPMYLSEMAPLLLRGALGVFCPVGLCAGVVLAQLFSLRSVFGTEAQWHIALSFYAILIVICYAPFMVYPESPKWLYIIKKDKDEAQAQIMRLRGNIKQEELAKELAEMEEESNLGQQSCSFKDVLCDSRLVMPLVIVCTYQGGQQLSGINAIFYYSVSIFLKAGMTPESAELANLAAGSLNLAISLLGPYLMANVNRRPLMLVSCFFCSIFLFSFAIMLYFMDSVAWFAQGCISCIFLYIFFFQLGVGPIPFFIGSELFEVAPRPVAMSLGSLSSWTCNFIIGMTFPTLQNAWGSLVFLPFSITCAVMFALTLKYLPETRGKDPSQVTPLIANGFKSKIV